MELMWLESQLKIFVRDVESDDQFLKLKRIVDLSQMLVKTKKHIVYPMVYLFMKLALILTMATATVERCFYAMNIIKNII